MVQPVSCPAALQALEAPQSPLAYVYREGNGLFPCVASLGRKHILMMGMGGEVGRQTEVDRKEHRGTEAD